jgi:hypothetical protein
MVGYKDNILIKSFPTVKLKQFMPNFNYKVLLIRIKSCLICKKTIFTVFSL